MILHSDNTGTDMVLKMVGPAEVRGVHRVGRADEHVDPGQHTVVRRLPPRRARLPDLHLGRRSLQRPTTLSSTLRSTRPRRWRRRRTIFVSFYARALQGEFFEHDQTLNEYRAILSIGDVIWLLPVPARRQGAVSPRAAASTFLGSTPVCAPRAACSSTTSGSTSASRSTGKRPPRRTRPRVAAWAAASSRALQLVKDSLTS